MHKLLFDQNLSYRIIKSIEHIFPASTHVGSVHLDKADDMAVWNFAKKNQFHIVTQDSDFNNINALYGFPPKVLWIHSGNKRSDAIIELLKKKADLINTFLENKEIGLLELT